MMVYGELGVFPLDVDIKLRMLTYWARLCLGDKHNISNTIYSLLYNFFESLKFESKRSYLTLDKVGDTIVWGQFDNIYC